MSPLKDGLSAVPRVVAVINIPTPYRHPMFKRLAESDLFHFSVLYCASSEPGRWWSAPPTENWFRVLSNRGHTWRGRPIHLTWRMLPSLLRLRPDIVVVAGFGPAQLTSFVYAAVVHAGVVLHTDGTLASEVSLGWLHRSIRRWAFARAESAIVAGRAGVDLAEFYGVDRERVFISPVPIDAPIFALAKPANIKSDLVFCGRIEAVKNPAFVLEVARATSELLRRPVSVAFLGDGSLKGRLQRDAAQDSRLDVSFFGHLDGADVARHLAASKVLLVPSITEPWGLVVAEGLAAGLFVVASPAVEAANELVEDGALGVVAPLDVARWAAFVASALRAGGLPRSGDDRPELSVLHAHSVEAAERGYRQAIVTAITRRRELGESRI